MSTGGNSYIVHVILAGILLLGVFGPVIPAEAETIVVNDITSDETWTSTLSPYVVSGNIIVDWNSTLTIESGVDVLFDSNASLTVYGHLMVHGTPESHVRFDHSTNAVPPWTWEGIDIHSDENSILYAEVIGARSNIQIEGSSNLVESCIIGSSDGFPGSGGVLIYNSAGPNYIMNSSLSVLKAAIALDEASNAVIAGNNIEHGDPGIMIFGGGHNLIHDNEIHSSVGADIQIFRDSYMNIISNNLLSGSQSGVSCRGCVDNLVINSTLESITHDFKAYGDSSLTVVNTSFDFSKVFIPGESSNIYVRNFVHVSAHTPEDMPIDGAQVMVDDDSLRLSEDETDSTGSIMWLEIADRTYYFSPDADFAVHDNITTLTVEFENWNFNIQKDSPNPRDVDMSTSHREVFIGAPPGYEPPVEAMNLKPTIAMIFSMILVSWGLFMSRKVGHKPDSGRREGLRRFLTYCLPFVLAEIVTGIVSYFYGFLSVPPVMGMGMLVDLTILVAGLCVVFILPREQPNTSRRRD
jgi:hypothetical protein